MQRFGLRSKDFRVMAGLILVISACVVVTPSTRSIESGSLAPSQGTNFSTMVTTPLESSIMSLSLNSVSQTSSGGLSSDEFASSSYYSISSLPTVWTTIPSLWLNNLSNRRRKRRARSEIYIDILELMKERGPMTPFEIALYARLNHKRTKECITFLSLCNYLKEIREFEGRTAYALTKEGLKFLERAETFFNDRRLVTGEITTHVDSEYSLR